MTIAKRIIRIETDVIMEFVLMENTIAASRGRREMIRIAPLSPLIKNRKKLRIVPDPAPRRSAKYILFIFSVYRVTAEEMINPEKKKGNPRII